MTEIFLKSKKYRNIKTFIDTDDLPIAKSIGGYWHPRYDPKTNSFYVMANVGKGDNRTTVQLHRLILGITERTLYADHIFHDTLDNRKKHLRIVTNSENQQNARNSKNRTTGITGVRWHERDKLWVARIKVNRKEIYLGSFKNKEDAKKSRKEGERKYFHYKNSLAK